MPSNKPDYQREYHKKHYQRNKERYIEQSRERRHRAQALLREVKNVPCKDCGMSYPSYVMQFDHLYDKKFNISQGVNKGWKESRLLEEIAKCDIVCANCHAIRTHDRTKEGTTCES